MLYFSIFSICTYSYIIMMTPCGGLNKKPPQPKVHVFKHMIPNSSVCGSCGNQDERLIAERVSLQPRFEICIA